MKTLFRIVLASMALIVVSTTIHAQMVIRFVASYGNDANPCTRTSPCRTMQAGVNATPAGSELQVIDSGGYGQNTVINKSITISATGVTATLVTTAGTGITIAAGATDVVILRGLTLTGVGTGTTGISIASAGAVHVERCAIERFNGDGIFYNTNGKLSVIDTISRQNTGDGLDVNALGGTAQVKIDNSHFEVNTNAGVHLNGGAAEASITRTTLSENVYGFFIENLSSPARAQVASSTAANNLLHGFVITNNAGNQMNIEYSVARGNGLLGMGITAGTMRVSNSVSTNNGFGFINTGGTFESRLNNTVAGNSVDSVGGITPIGGI